MDFIVHPLLRQTNTRSWSAARTIRIGSGNMPTPAGTPMCWVFDLPAGIWLRCWSPNASVAEHSVRDETYCFDEARDRDVAPDEIPAACAAVEQLVHRSGCVIARKFR